MFHVNLQGCTWRIIPFPPFFVVNIDIFPHDCEMGWGRLGGGWGLSMPIGKATFRCESWGERFSKEWVVPRGWGETTPSTLVLLPSWKKSSSLLLFPQQGWEPFSDQKNIAESIESTGVFFSLVKLCQQNTKRIFRIQLRMDRVVGLPNHFPYDPGWFTLYPDNYVQLRKRETRIKENWWIASVQYLLQDGLYIIYTYIHIYRQCFRKPSHTSRGFHGISWLPLRF